MEKRHISWEEFHNLTRVLAKQIEESGFVPDFLVGITCGGLVPLTLLAEMFGTKNVTTISARSYSGTERGELDIFVQPNVDLRGKNILLIDEIADSGETIKQITELLRLQYHAADVKSAVVVVNAAHGKYTPDYFVDETDRWVVFPWDK